MDTEATPRQSKPNGIKAFDIASDMEGDLRGCKQVASTLRLIALSDDLERDASDALNLLSDTLGDLVEAAETKRGEVFRLTWGYKHLPEYRSQP